MQQQQMSEVTKIPTGKIAAINGKPVEDGFSVDGGDFSKHIIPIIEQYKDTKNLEVEFRLGFFKLNEKKNFTFCTDISEDFYNTIKEAFDNSTSFKSKTKVKMVDEFSGDIRRSTVEKPSVVSDVVPTGTTSETTDGFSAEVVLIKKTKLHTIDFTLEGTPFDIRVSFSKETPVKNFDASKIQFTRSKNRTTYVYKKFNYDLTEIETNGNKTYEFELELNKTLTSILKTTTVEELLESSFLKLMDVVKLCEEPTTDIVCKLK